MKSGYDQFFQKARKAADQKTGVAHPKVEFKKSVSVKAKAKPRMNLQMSEEEVEMQLRRRLKMNSPKRNAKRSSIPWKIVSASFIGLVVAFLGFENHEKVENFLKRVEFQMNGAAYAEETKSKPEDKSSATPSSGASTDSKKEDEKKPALTNVELDHLQKLNDRKRELDAREEELLRVENELQVQRQELDKRLKELEEMRVKISSMLENRVKTDEDKLDTLVQMYSNMKAPQAAKVFETMDEDLAVEILGRMKKKNAADIMNLLKPEKAQILSEMFAGFKRRTPASVQAGAE